jgi:hypothetical protein
VSEVPVEWLLEGDPWVVYRTKVDLCGETPVQADRDRQAMLGHVQISALLAELASWPGHVLSSHKSAGQLYHKLTFISDLGVVAEDPGMDRIISRILERQSLEGPFQLPVNVPQHFGGDGQEQWAWALCDAPLIVYALVQLGLAQDPRVRRASAYLVSLVRDSGWPCVVSKELGKFRGPGRKEDPCPYATLAMLKMLSVLPDLQDSPASHIGAETLLALWSASRERHPYMFYMGTDFRKLKAPFIWYDIVHVLDVLSRFTWLRQDTRLLDMLGVVTSKADAQGRYTPESIWTAWQGWDFGQKRQPSRWLTLLVGRILLRMREVDGSASSGEHAHD